MSAEDVNRAVKEYARAADVVFWPDPRCARHGGVTTLDRTDPKTGLPRLSWQRADPEVHILAVAVDDDEVGPLVAAAYRLREKCGHYDAWHAVRHERPLVGGTTV